MTEKVNQLIRFLEELQNTSYTDDEAARRHDVTADAALRLIFHIGRKRIAFDEEQKKSVARNLVSAIKPLQINIEGHGFEYRRRLNSIILKKRSALQFLVDDYGRIPIEGQTLSAVFERVNLKETIGILDEIIEDHRSDSDSDDPHSDQEFPGIPSSHSWWF